MWVVQLLKQVGQLQVRLCAGAAQFNARGTCYFLKHQMVGSRRATLTDARFFGFVAPHHHVVLVAFQLDLLLDTREPSRRIAGCSGCSAWLGSRNQLPSRAARASKQKFERALAQVLDAGVDALKRVV